jgi:hypothetical protein
MVNRELKGLSVKLTQDLDLYCRSYGDQRNSFHLKAIQKSSSNNFLENKRKLCHVR